MTGELKLGKMIKKKLNFEEYVELKVRLSQDPNSDVREAYNIINNLEEYIKFLSEEFIVVINDYNSEVIKSNELYKQLINTLKILKTRK